jgi:hypothetical protein
MTQNDHWLSIVVRLFEAKTGNLKELAQIAGANPATFYIGANLAGADLRGQDLRGMRFSYLTSTTFLSDSGTLFDPDANVIGDALQSNDEPSIEEILHSIRRIISIDDPEKLREFAASAIADALDISLRRKSRVRWEGDGGRIRIVISTSKNHRRPSYSYWYGYYEDHKTYLEGAEVGFLVLCCQGEDSIYVIPSDIIEKLTHRMSKTYRKTSMYWHVKARTHHDGSLWLLLAGGNMPLDSYRLAL